MSPKKRKLLLIELGTAFVAANAVFLFVRYQEKGRLVIADWTAIAASFLVAALILGFVYCCFSLMVRAKEPN